MLGQEIIASYSAFPLKLSYKDLDVESVLSMTTMTDPNHKGRGLFTKLATELYFYLANKGVPVVFGFPNEQSQPIFINKLFWDHVQSIPTYVVTKNTLTSLENINIGKVIRDDGFDLDYSLTQKYDLVYVKKNKEYLIWRYKKNPINKYRNYTLPESGVVTSYIIIKKYLGSIDIIDIQVASLSEAELLLAHIVRVFKKSNAEKMYCWVPEHHFIYDVIKKYGFFDSGQKTNFGLRILINTELPCNFKLYNSWYLQMGDSDVY